MADIVILGVEMPSCCLMCPMYTISGCRASKRIFPDWMNVAAVPKDCPLLPLPEGHGRIVDAGEIRTRLSRKLTACKPGTIEELTFAVSIDIVDHADTIVPAEGGGEDG